MAAQPVGHALTEWKVVQVSFQFTYRPIGDGKGSDEASVAHPLRTKQPQVIGGHLIVFEPALSPKVPAADSKGNLVSGISHGPMEACGQLRCYAFVRVEVKYPLVLERNIREGPVFVFGFISTEDLLGFPRRFGHDVGIRAICDSGR